MASARPGISLCMIARDEQELLEDCLLSVQGVVDEILVADTGSGDDTKQIAMRCGAQVYDYPWDFSFSNARNFIMEKAAYEWILLLDADERLFPQDGAKLLDFVLGATEDGAHFKVYNHVGAYGDGQYTLHNALRLVRNNGLYRFVGDIHEQLSRVDHAPMDSLFCVTDIRLHHLGYLDSVVTRKGKRERNIPLLLRELEKNPESPFMLFNLGNEYMAMKEYEKALEWYDKSRERYKKHEAFGPHLLFRIALCHYHLNRYPKAVKALAKGLAVYPGCTDMAYLQGRVYMDWRRDFLAEQSFQKAIAMGQPHATLRFSDDCATTRPLLSLAALHERQHDFGKAAEYYIRAIQADNNLHSALYGLASAYEKMGCPPEEIERGIVALFANLDHAPNRMMLANVLLSQGLWELCEKHLRELNQAEGPSGELAMLWGKYCLRAGQYAEAVEHLRSAVQNIEAVRVFPGAKRESAVQLFAALLMSRVEDIEAGVQAVGQAFGRYGELLCRQILSVLDGRKEELLRGENPREILAVFSAFLKVLLQCGAFDLFEKVLYVYNYIDSPQVLLSLAQLYLECGFPQLAAQSVLRSVKELDVMDDSGAQVLLESLLQVKCR
ncbi:MAG: tetratricopeptide repeat protein [Candidatus Limiplasma sp.]|nr:tetratricopeptide repeat protein [Candidatus Limiplasma sp.]